MIFEAYTPRSLMRAIVFSLLVIFGTGAWVMSHASPELSDLRINEDKGVFFGTVDLTDPEGLARNEVEVRIISEWEYQVLDARYTDFIRNLQVEYKRKNKRNGQISIEFPYEPVEDTEIILEVKWSEGKIRRSWMLEMAEVRQNLVLSEEAVVRVEPVDVVGEGTADQSVGSAREKMDNLRIDTVSGDNWRNLAETVRQAYLRLEPINTEQVMLALRKKNSQAFTGRNDSVLRAGISLILPTYYDIQARNGEQARNAVRRLLEHKIARKPRLELADAKPGKTKTSALEEQDAVKRGKKETEQRITDIDEQLEQVQKLINIKSEQLEQLEASVILANAEREETEPTKTVGELLLERARLLLSEMKAQPLFWAAFLLSSLIAIILLLYLSSLTYRRQASPKTRAKIMGDLRKNNMHKSLFSEKDAETQEQPRSFPADSEIVDTSARIKTGEFIQDNLVGANLDLARAYINMGDMKKARTLLDQVIESSNDNEREQARKLLEQIQK